MRTLYGIRETEITTAHDALESYIAQHMLKRTEDGRIIATQNGIHILNRIIEDLMI